MYWTVSEQHRIKIFAALIWVIVSLLKWRCWDLLDVCLCVFTASPACHLTVKLGPAVTHLIDSWLFLAMTICKNWQRLLQSKLLEGRDWELAKQPLREAHRNMSTHTHTQKCMNLNHSHWGHPCEHPHLYVFESRVQFYLTPFCFFLFNFATYYFFLLWHTSGCVQWKDWLRAPVCA